MGIMRDEVEMSPQAHEAPQAYVTNKIVNIQEYFVTSKYRVLFCATN
jgi:hypothetical protein